MASSQFQIPDSYSNPLAEALAIADADRHTPETQPEAFGYIKDIESRLQDYRLKAVARENERTSFLKAATQAARPFVPAPKPYYEKLVEKEAALGGKLLKKPADVVSQNFWYHDDGDWFYHAVNTEKQTTVIRFQTTPSAIHKLVDGTEVPFAPEEAETFSKLPRLYEKKVLAEQYGEQGSEQYDLAA